MAQTIFILFIAFVILFVVFLFQYFGQKRKPKQTVSSFTGGLGTGKSFIGVALALKRLRGYRWLYILGQLEQVELPLLYSNIPILVKNRLIQRIFLKLVKKKIVPKYEWSVFLKFEHITKQERLTQCCVVFIDELGSIANQYSYDNPFVMQYLEQFFRLFRHWLDGVIVWTDQSSSNVSKPIRLRTNIIYNLKNFRRVFLWAYKVDVTEVMLTEDAVTTTDGNLEQTEQPYYMGYLPFKYFKRLDISRLFTYKKYDSRAYRRGYDPVQWAEITRYFEYLTDDFIEMPNITDLKVTFKKQGYVTREQFNKALLEWKTKKE